MRITEGMMCWWSDVAFTRRVRDKELIPYLHLHQSCYKRHVVCPWLCSWPTHATARLCPSHTSHILLTFTLSDLGEKKHKREREKIPYSHYIA